MVSKGLSEKNIRDSLFVKNMCLHEFPYTVSLICIYDLWSQNCTMLSLSRLLNLENQISVSELYILYMPLYADKRERANLIVYFTNPVS